MIPLTDKEAYARLADRCAMAEVSTGEALTKLRQWGITGAEAYKVVQRLVNERFIDDERFARSFVRDKVNNAHWGVNKIRLSLHQKGIDNETARIAIAEELDEETYFANLAGALRSKGRNMPSPLNREDYARLARFAVGRGYEPSLVSEMLSDEHYWRDVDE
ncbi:MAG: RecX family transcriptional regulator [Bacteroides sp.]|nr:RecX family transcriptional regulator [Bacteroides sp.]MCM1379379.1 RecX family transcriptional regulator [Bacteroides sp.]MCM1445239.1 RecX family transcriptional regulator [Prevotella sp.]